MVAGQTIADCCQQCRTIASRCDDELLELPRLAGPQRQAFGVDDSAHSAILEHELPAELRARGEREDRRLAAGRSERDQTIECARTFGLRNTVMLRVGVLAELQPRR